MINFFCTFDNFTDVISEDIDRFAIAYRAAATIGVFCSDEERPWYLAAEADRLGIESLYVAADFRRPNSNS